MKTVLYKMVVLCLAMMLLVSTDGIAQENRIGTNAASELLIPVGARYLAMGGAPIATVRGVEAIYWNPAGVARSDYTADAMFTHVQHIADININYVALSVRFGNVGTFGFSVKAMDIGDIAVTTELAPDGTGATLTPQFVTAGLTYSRALTDRISVGATVNFISEDLETARVSASGVAFDFGVQYRDLASINGLSLAVAIKNLGPSMSFDGSGLLRRSQPDGVDRGPTPLQLVSQDDELPSYITIGASYNVTVGETSNLEFVSTFQDNNFDDDHGRFGVEYNYDNLFYVRGGYVVSPDASDDAFIYGLTAGAGLHYDFPNIGISIDYAYRAVDFFDASNIFSIKLGF
ncbi:MAG: PorV/PorQ family protein [bacterium]